jgi:hypothetical protein
MTKEFFYFNDDDDRVPNQWQENASDNLRIQHRASAEKGCLAQVILRDSDTGLGHAHPTR